jgi:hypothetical protein
MCTIEGTIMWPYLGFRAVRADIAGSSDHPLMMARLPRHVVNGWTGEPREKYYELIGHKERK